MKKQKSSTNVALACYYKMLLKKLRSKDLTVFDTRMESCFSLWKMTPFRGGNKIKMYVQFSLTGVESSRVD
jgi:hypothetical protein